MVASLVRKVIIFVPYALREDVENLGAFLCGVNNG